MNWKSAIQKAFYSKPLARLKKGLLPADKFDMCSKGFSLIELLVTLAITTILAAVALPKYSTYVANNRAMVYANQLSSDLQFAKALSIAQNTAVTLCQTQSAGSTNCNNTSPWQTGWFVKANPNGNATASILRNFQFNASLTPNTNVNLTITGTQPLVFNANGFPGSNYTFTIKPASCSVGYQITVQADGIINSPTTVSCP